MHASYHKGYTALNILGRAWNDDECRMTRNATRLCRGETPTAPTASTTPVLTCGVASSGAAARAFGPISVDQIQDLGTNTCESICCRSSSRSLLLATPLYLCEDGFHRPGNMGRASERVGAASQVQLATWNSSIRPLCDSSSSTISNRITPHLGCMAAQQWLFCAMIILCKPSLR